MAGETQTEFNGEVNEPEVTEGVLPSDEPKVESSDDWIKDNTSENGKLFGRFDKMEDALDYYREQEVTHTNNMREVKNEQKAKQEEAKSVQADLEAESLKNEAIDNMSQKLIENGMVFTDEMTEELGDISQMEVKVNAYEKKEIIEHNYTVLGGKEQYNEAMEFAGTIYDESQQKAMMDSIANNQVSPEFRELALLGLQAKMGGNPSDEQATTRISGRSANEPAVQGYSSQEEMFDDRRKGQKNPVKKEEYLRRLALTDDRIMSLH